MRGFTAAWLLGLAIVTWRQVHVSHRMPVPGALVGVSGLFAGLALIADVAPSSAKVVTWTAWGLDLAGVLNILPAGLSGQITQAEQASQPGPAVAAPQYSPGTSTGGVTAV